MALGMSYDEFWHSSPWRAVAYREANDIRKEIMNQEMWLQGLYNSDAVRAPVEMFGWSLGGRKGTKPSGYMTEPIPVTSNERNRAKKKSIDSTLAFFEKGQQG